MDDMFQTEAGIPQAVDSQEKRQKAAPGENKTRIWSFLQRERVGQELLFTTEQAQRVADEVGVRRSHVYGALTRFEEEGLIKRVRSKKGEGTLVTFLPHKKSGSSKQKEVPTVKIATSTPKKFSPATTFGEALEGLDKEITNLEAKLEGLKIKMASLEKTIATKTDLRDNLLTLIEKEGQ